MDTVAIAVLAVVVSAFAIFAGVLAFVERETRNLHRLRTPPVPQVKKPGAVEERKAA